MRSRFLKYAIDLCIWTLAAPLAFVLRLGSDKLSDYLLTILIYTVIGLVVQALLLGYFKFHLRIWHSVSLIDLQHLAKGVAVGGVVMLVVGSFLPTQPLLPRSVPIISTALALIGMVAVRVLTRSYYDADRKKHGPGIQKRTLIVGAGEAGIMIAKEMLNNAAAGFVPVGFLDDNAGKHGRLLLGLPIAGSLSALSEVAKQLERRGSSHRYAVSAGYAGTATDQRCQGSASALPHFAQPERNFAGPGRHFAIARC